MQISKAQARRFLLSYQGLDRPLHGTAALSQGKAGVMDYIRRVGCIQFDPLNITGQNADLVLQARVADYRPHMLPELLYAERALLDGLDKVQSIYAREDWPFFERRRMAARQTRVRAHEQVSAAMPQVLAAIEQRGPLSAHELGMNETVAWYWGTPSRLSRAALEILDFRGEVVVHHRVHTRKYYDLARRCIPPELFAAPDPFPSLEDYHDWHVLRRVGSVGLLWNRGAEVWLGMLEMKGPQRKAAIERLLGQGRLCQVSVEGLKEPFYYRAQDQATLEAALDGGDQAAPAVRLMAPLDNLLWDRRMLQALFDFEYTWEVYVPAARRRYGYYVLPVLAAPVDQAGERFIARCEPVLDRKRQALVLKNWWWEPGVDARAWQAAAQQALERLGQALGAQAVEGAVP